MEKLYSRRQFLEKVKKSAEASFVSFFVLPKIAQLPDFSAYINMPKNPEIGEKLSDQISGHPMHGNFLVKRFEGKINFVSPDDLRTYIGQWQEAATDPLLWKRNRTMAQLLKPLPDGEIRKRELDFDIQHPQTPQGLGFTKEDLSSMAEMTKDGFKEHGPLFSMGKDNIHRGSAVTSIEDLPKVLEKYAEEMTAMRVDYNDHQTVNHRIALMKADLGITEEQFDKDGKWTEIKTHETSLGVLQNDGHQPEQVTKVTFSQLTNDQIQTLSTQDIRNSALFVILFDQKSGKQRVEVYVLSTTPDINDTGRDDKLVKAFNTDGTKRNADGGRLVPVGQAQEKSKTNTSSEPGGPNETTQQTPTPPVTLTPPVVVTRTPPSTPTPPTKKPCNQGRGNGPEGCDPGNSNNVNPSRDERGQVPGSSSSNAGGNKTHGK